jgi:GNAT superfamily N-acetyltransferase
VYALGDLAPGLFEHTEWHATPDDSLALLMLFRARYYVSHITAMWRLTLDPARCSPAPTAAVRLTPADLPALERLFATGTEAGDAPDTFAPNMLEQGVYHGLYEWDSLVAAARTHLLVQAQGVAAIGNVYTRRDRRGHGLATQVVGAVVAELMRISPALDVIALNVN